MTSEVIASMYGTPEYNGSLAYRLGAHAAALGLQLRNNPFRVDNVTQWQEWRNGWWTHKNRQAGLDPHSVDGRDTHPY